MSEEIILRAKELLETLEYINVATVSADGLPWNTPVFARYDNSLHFYWTSWVKAQHSINIEQTGNAFVTLYDSTRKRGQNNRRCLYLQGKANEVVSASEIRPLLELIYGNESSSMKVEDYLGTAIKRIYKYTPFAAWLNDISERQIDGQTVKMRIEVPLEQLTQHVKAA